MLSKRHKDLIEQGNKLFTDKLPILSLWQDIADNFYPERADFTISRGLGDEFAAHLDTSYPIMARRDLGNAFSTMLRPTAVEYFKNSVKYGSDDLDEAGRQWLEMTTRVQRKAIYDRNSGFVRATKEGDHDFATFGQCVISSEVAVHRYEGPVLLHRCWHLRDVAWVEDSFGKICEVHRNWKATASELMKYFKNKNGVHENVSRAAKEDPLKEFCVRHVVIDDERYDLGTDRKVGRPWVSIFLDIDNDHVLEEKRVRNNMYVIPRFQTVSGTQYAHSPATIIALPDARLLQSMTYTLLTAGEKAVDPPLVGVEDAIKGGVEAFPGGYTTVDSEYDERLGEVLRPLHTIDKSAIPVGLEMQQDIRSQIAEAFYISKLTLPAPTRDMTAFETAKRIEEYIRNAAPLFEPMEQEYNGQLFDLDFQLLFDNGAFGPRSNMPESLAGKMTEFEFISPIREAADRVRGQQFMEAKGLIAEAAPLDPLAPQIIDARIALREALRGVGTPAKWMRDEADMQRIQQSADDKAQQDALLARISQGAQVAEQVGNAGQAMQAAEQGGGQQAA